MRYFQIDALGNSGDAKLAIVSEDVPELGIYAHFPARGKSVADRYPADARTHLQARYRGTKLSSLLGNTLSWLIVDTAFKDLVMEHCKESEIEIFPLSVYDHKKKLHSADYWVINPLGCLDCVSRQHSEIEYLDKTEADVIGVDKFVFRRDRLENNPPLFRVPEEPSAYFISQALARSLKGRNCTNVYLDEIELV